MFFSRDDKKSNDEFYFQTMNLYISIQCFLFSLNSIWFVHSASSSPVFASSVKYKNPKLDKYINNWKNEGGNDDGNDDGSKFIIKMI